MGYWHKGSAFLYVDRVVPDDPIVLINPYDAWVCVCRHCAGVHFLKANSYRTCSNPECGFDGTRLPVGQQFAWPLAFLAGDQKTALVATYALGGPEAVLDLLRSDPPLRSMLYG